MNGSNKRNEIECPNGLKVVWHDSSGFPSYEEFAASLKEKAERPIYLRGNPFLGGGNIFNEPLPNPNPLVQILIDFRGNIVNEYKEKYEALLKEKEEDSNCITW
jgi:hypothetical protein